MGAGLWASEIKQMKDAARPEDATDLTKCLQLHVRVEMMDRCNEENTRSKDLSAYGRSSEKS